MVRRRCDHLPKSPVRLPHGKAKLSIHQDVTLLQREGGAVDQGQVIAPQFSIKLMIELLSSQSFFTEQKTTKKSQGTGTYSGI